MPPMPAALRLPLPATGCPASIGWHERLVVLLPCPFCGYEFDRDALGFYGCPNCHGEGLDDADQMRLEPGRGRSPAVLPLVSGGTRATQSGNDLRGGMVGKLFSEGHVETVAPEKKSAMRKIILAKRPQCGQIVRVNQPRHHEQRNQNSQHHTGKRHQGSRNLPILSAASMAVHDPRGRHIPDWQQDPPSGHDASPRKEWEMASRGIGVPQCQYLPSVGMGGPETSYLEVVSPSGVRSPALYSLHNA